MTSRKGSANFGMGMSGSGLQGSADRDAKPIKQEKSILKVAVLSEPYFPKQKLSVRFNSVVLQHMELEDLSEGTGMGIARGIAPGHLFGIVQKMDKSLRSYAKYGTVCEIVAHEQTSTIVFNPYDRSRD